MNRMIPLPHSPTHVQVQNCKQVPVFFEKPTEEEKWEQIMQMVPFRNWCNNIDPRLIINSITIQSVDMFGKEKVGFLKFKADIEDSDGTKLPGIVFMRGGAVAVLIILKCTEDGKEYTVLTIQPRVPVASAAFTEIPAGMLDGSGDFQGVAAKELEEETHLKISTNDLINLTALAAGPVYPSAGGCDEAISLFLYKKEVSQSYIQDLQGKLTGVRAHGEKITLKVIETSDLINQAPDVKALSAWCLYKELVSAGKLPADS